jgi:hypothetical protein
VRATGHLKSQVLVALAFCLTTAGAGAADLTNDDVIKMSKSGLSEQILLQVIESNPTKFDTSPAAIIVLKEAGVPESVLAKMLQMSTRGDSTASSAAPLQAPAPLASEAVRCTNDSLTDVVLIQGQRRITMRRDEGETRDDHSTRGTLAFVLGIVPDRITMTFPRSRADVRMLERRPIFEANQPDERSPKDFLTIVRLKVDGAARKIEAVRDKSGSIVWNEQTINPEYRVDVAVDRGPSCRTKTSPTPVVPVRSRPTKPLDPGEYAVVRESVVMFAFGVD